MNAILASPSPPKSKYQRKRHKVRRATPEERVNALLRFPFSPAVREHTIRVLLADPLTRELALERLRASQ